MKPRMTADEARTTALLIVIPAVGAALTFVLLALVRVCSS